MRESFWRLTGFVTAVGLSAVLVGSFYDRGWHFDDDGVFAYMAWRLLEGDVLTRDFADIHPGLLNFFHAGVFAMLGESLLSLRKPLAILMVAQAAIIFWILKPRGVATALVGSLAVTSTSFILAPHVSVNWYCLFLCSFFCWDFWSGATKSRLGGIGLFWVFFWG